jgi:tape measure domain-containing protein
MPDGQILGNEIISKEAIQDPVTLNNNLKEVLKTIEQITDSALKLNSSLKGVSTFGEFAKAQKESQTATKSLTDSQKEALSIQDKLRKTEMSLINSYNDELTAKKRLTREYNLQNKLNVEQEGSIKKLRATVAKLTNQYEGLNLKTKEGRQRAKELSQEILKQEQTLKKYDAAIGKHQRNVGNYSGALGGFGKQVMALAGSYLSLYGAWNLVKNIFTTTKELDSLSLSYKTIIKDSNELSGAQAFLSDITARYGLDLLETSKAYIKFRASAEITGLSIKKTNNIFESFAKTGAVMGKSAEDLNSIFLALEQMLNKGRVSAEELRRQLGEKVPAAVAIMAKSMGVTTEKLDEMLRAGTVITKDVLPNFAKVMEQTLGIESVKYVNTLVSAQNRLKTAWIELVDSMESSGVFMRVLNDAASVLNKLMPYYQSQKRILVEVNDEMTNYRDILGDIFKKEGEQAAKNQLAKYIEDVTNKSTELQTRIENMQKVKLWTLFHEGTEAVKVLKLEQEKLFEQWEANKKIQVQLLSFGFSDNPDDDAKKAIGYLQQLQSEVEDYYDKISKEPRVLGEEPKYWKQIAEWQAEIAKRQELIAKITGKTKDTKKKESKELTGFINLLEKEIKEKQELIKLANSKAEIDRLTNELKLRQDLLEIIKTTNDLQLLTPKGITQGKEELPTAFGESDADREKRMRLFELAGKYGFNKNNEFAIQLNELNELLDNDIITKTQYFSTVATLWMDHNEKIIDSIYTLADEITGAWDRINKEMIEAAEQRVREYDELIKETERQLEEETKNQEEGKNNNVAILKGQLSEQKTLREKAIKDYEKAQKQQAAIELVEQAVSITTSIANVIKGFSEIPIVGVVLGLAAAASLIGAFASYKQRIKNVANEKFAEGEVDIQGDAKPHSQGGKQVEIERHESVIAAEPTLKSKNILSMVNEGKLTDKDLGLTGTVNLNDKLKASFIGNVPIIHVDKTNTRIIESELYQLRKSQQQLLDYFENRSVREIVDPKTGKLYRKKGNRSQEFGDIKTAYGFD